jgi:hypothetical protein
LNNSTTDLDLPATFVNPWWRRDVAARSLRPYFVWKPIASGACMVVGMSAVAVALVALRLTLFANLGVDARLPLTAMLAAACTGTLAFAGAHRLGDQVLSPGEKE